MKIRLLWNGLFNSYFPSFSSLIQRQMNFELTQYLYNSADFSVQLQTMETFPPASASYPRMKEQRWENWGKQWRGKEGDTVSQGLFRISKLLQTQDGIFSYDQCQILGSNTAKGNDFTFHKLCKSSSSLSVSELVLWSFTIPGTSNTTVSWEGNQSGLK